MPILIFLFLLVDFITIGIVIADIYLLHEWYQWRDTYNDEFAKRCLAGVLILTLFLAFGRFPVSRLLSMNRKNEDEPEMKKNSKGDMLERPDGSVIYIEQRGNAANPPLVLIHGWNSNRMGWYYQEKYFSRHYRVILIDLPGLGRSKRPDTKNYSIRKMAEDLGAVIDHLQLQNAVLYGHSIGGMIILTYCTSQARKNLKQKVKAIVLQHTTFTDPSRTCIFSRFIQFIKKPVIYPVCYIMIALSPLFWLNKWLSYYNGTAHLFTRILTYAGTQTPAQLDFTARLSAMAEPAIVARGVLGMFETYEVSKAIKGLDIPTLIIAAGHDRLTRPVASEYMHMRMPNAELAVLSPAGHQGLVERHKETNKAVKEFLNGLKQTKINAYNEAILS